MPDEIGHGVLLEADFPESVQVAFDIPLSRIAYRTADSPQRSMREMSESLWAGRARRRFLESMSQQDRTLRETNNVNIASILGCLFAQQWESQVPAMNRLLYNYRQIDICMDRDIRVDAFLVVFRGRFPQPMRSILEEEEKLEEAIRARQSPSSGKPVAKKDAVQLPRTMKFRKNLRS